MIKRKKYIKIIITALFGVMFIATAIFSIFSGINKNQTQKINGNSDIYKNLSAFSTEKDLTGIGYTNGKFSMFNDDGDILWTTVLGNGQPLNDVVMCDNFVILVSEGREVIAFDKNTGDKLMTFNMPFMALSAAFNEKSGVLTVSGQIRNEYRFYIFNIHDTPDSNGEINYRFSGRHETQFATKLYSMENLDDGRVIVTGGNSVSYIVDIEADSPSLKEIFVSDFPIIAVSEISNGFVSMDIKGTATYYDNDFKVLNKKSNSYEFDSACLISGQFVAKVKNGGVFGFDINRGEKSFFINSRYESKIYLFSNGFLINENSEIRLYNVDIAKAVSYFSTAFKISLPVSFLLLAAFVLMLLITFMPKVNEFLKTEIIKFGLSLKNNKFVYLGLIPTFILIIIFYYIPISWGMGLSFFDYTAGEKAVFVGFQNFAAVMKNEYFWSGMGNMVIFLITDILKAIIPPIFFAELIMAVKNKTVSFWMRVLLFVPGILPGVATTIVWMNGIFGNQGLVNDILIKVGLPSYVQNWMFQSKTALGSLLMFGFPWIGAYLIFYGAVMGLPTSMYEAAKLDGCGWFKRIFKFDIPLILPQIKYIFITSFIASIQSFDRIYITTQGEYNTGTPALEMFFQLFKYNQYGIASAMSVFLFLFLAIATVLNFRMKSNTSD